MDEPTVAGQGRERAAEIWPFPLIDVAGSPTEMGRGYGREAGERIHRSVAIYQHAYLQQGVSWDRARQVARAFAAQIDAYFPDFLAEIKAIAQGAELPYEDIVAINARTELLYGCDAAVPHAVDSDPDGCTGLVAMPEATASGHTLHAQNWDWRDECADSAVVLRRSPDSGPRTLIFVEAGMLARCGLNSAGVALTGNFLQTDRDYGRQGIPVPLVRRRILMSNSLAEAISIVLSAPRAFANNLMISHDGGECIDLEATPGEVFWIEPAGGLLVHANHFKSAGALAKVKDVGLGTNSDSLYRDRRLREFLEQRAGLITIETLKEGLSDRYGAPRAVCRSPVEGPGGKVSSTVATIIMDTVERKMWVAKRPYGPHSYQEYSLE